MVLMHVKTQVKIRLFRGQRSPIHENQQGVVSQPSATPMSQQHSYCHSTLQGLKGGQCLCRLAEVTLQNKTENQERFRSDTEKANLNAEVVHIWQQLLRVFIYISENLSMNCPSQYHLFNAPISFAYPAYTEDRCLYLSRAHIYLITVKKVFLNNQKYFPKNKYACSIPLLVSK